MKRWQKVLILIGLMIVGSLWPSVAKAGVDDFEFKELEIEYRLSKDAEGRSVLAVKEKFIAVFPDFNQNRGIIRSIPLDYRDHSLSLKMGDIYRNGSPAPIYSDESKDGFRVLTIRDSSDESYLHGENEYEFNYTMRDVILKPNDADVMDFYWDTNGTGWGQPFGTVRAKVVLDDSIKNDLIKDRYACYTGAHGANGRQCNGYYDEANSTFYFQTTDKLAAYENMTLAIAFKPGTFVDYVAAGWEGPLLLASAIAGITVLPLSIVAFLRFRVVKKTQKLTSIPTEYLPPEEIDIYSGAMFNANFLDTAANKMLPAGLIDMAVNRRIKIIETEEEKALFNLGNSHKYEIEVLNKENWTDNEKNFFRGVFGREMTVGARYSLKRDDYRIVLRMNDFNKQLKKQFVERGLIDEDGTKAIKKPVRILAVVSLVLAAFCLIPSSDYHSRDFYRYLPEMYGFLKNWLPMIWVMVGAGTLISLVCLFEVAVFTKLTDQGLAILTKLRGLERYIKMAEKDRLAFAQSVGTAERDINQRIMLYERLLPYAMIFGLEKSWNEVLSQCYQEADYEPDWYLGAAAFSAAHFSSSMRSFSSVASSSYSSGSSGSGGGGSSGGGGGGGGGGGC